MLAKQGKYYNITVKKPINIISLDKLTLLCDLFRNLLVIKMGKRRRKRKARKVRQKILHPKRTHS